MKPERIIGAFLALVGAVYLIANRAHSLGTARSPGEGMVPLVMGTLLLLTSLTLVCRRWTARQELPDRASLARVLKVAVLVLAYIALMPLVGFKIMTFTVTLLAGWILGNTRWTSNLVFSLVVTLVAAALFQGWLLLPLPEPFL